MSALPLSALPLSALPLSALHCVLTLSALPLSALPLSALPLSALALSALHCVLTLSALALSALHCAARDAADRVPTIKIVSDCQHLFLFVRILACPGVVQRTVCPPFNLISPLHQRLLGPPVVGIRLYIWTRHIPYPSVRPWYALNSLYIWTRHTSVCPRQDRLTAQPRLAQSACPGPGVSSPARRDTEIRGLLGC